MKIDKRKKNSLKKKLFFKKLVKSQSKEKLKDKFQK